MREDARPDRAPRGAPGCRTSRSPVQANPWIPGRHRPGDHLAQPCETRPGRAWPGSRSRIDSPHAAPPADPALRAGPGRCGRLVRPELLLKLRRRLPLRPGAPPRAARRQPGRPRRRGGRAGGGARAKLVATGWSTPSAPRRCICHGTNSSPPRHLARRPAAARHRRCGEGRTRRLLHDDAGAGAAANALMLSSSSS